MIATIRSSIATMQSCFASPAENIGAKSPAADPWRPESRRIFGARGKIPEIGCEANRLRDSLRLNSGGEKMQWREVSFHCAAVDRDRDVPSAALLYNGGRDAPVRYPKPDLVLKRRGVSPLRHHEPCLSGMNRFRRMPVAVLIGTWEVGDAPTFQDPVGFREDGLGRLYGTALPTAGAHEENCSPERFCSLPCARRIGCPCGGSVSAPWSGGGRGCWRPWRARGW